MSKQRNVSVKVADVTIYEETLVGANKGKKVQYIRELMQKADSLLNPGTTCVLYYQQDGAKGWAKFEYVTGFTECVAL